MKLLRVFCGLKRGEVSLFFAAANMYASGWLIVGRYSLVGYAVLVFVVTMVSIGAVTYSKFT